MEILVVNAKETTMTQKKQLARSWLLSSAMAFVTQFALSLIPRFFSSSSSLLFQLSLSVLLLTAVLGLGGWFRGILGIHGSASAFVFATVIFIWCFYILVIRKSISLVMDFVFNGQVIMLVIGLCRILKSDPGLVTCEKSSQDKLIESSTSEVGVHVDEELELSAADICCDSTQAPRRVRYCGSCNAYIKGFDHHCPAFGNCIGQNNHLLFMLLLLGFLVIEASYVACSTEYVAEFGISSRNKSEIISLCGSLGLSTRMFCILQLVWKLPFLAWHLYCICFNIRTDEWINWRKYPEFQLISQSHSERRFTNPYHKGILNNVKEFLSPS